VHAAAISPPVQDSAVPMRSLRWISASAMRSISSDSSGNSMGISSSMDRVIRG